MRDFGKGYGLAPGDNIGNRRSFREFKVPADDVGNRKDISSREQFLPDDLGNSIDIAPTHMQSGVLGAVDGRRNRRREDPYAPRAGRYLVGGVNPTVSGQIVPPVPSQERNSPPATKPSGGARRVFEFDEDDRFDYILKSDPEQKRKVAEDAVRTILERAGLNATVNAVLLKEDERSGVMVLVDEVAGDQNHALGRSDHELIALNFLVNKIVNRYPDDRIRLAVLPKAEEALFVEHFRKARPAESPKAPAPIPVAVEEVA